MKFFVNLLLDSIWGFIFSCLGAGFVLSRLNGDVILSPQDAAWLLGATVTVALLLRVPVWLMIWLENEKAAKTTH